MITTLILYLYSYLSNLDYSSINSFVYLYECMTVNLFCIIFCIIIYYNRIDSISGSF